MSTDPPLAEAAQQLGAALATLRAAAAAAGSSELVAALRLCGWVEREAQRVGVGVVAAMAEQGVFAASRRRPAHVVADLLGVGYGQARRLVVAAEHAGARSDLQGQRLPARLPATAAAFHPDLDSGPAASDPVRSGSEGLSLGHVEVIAGLMTGPVAARLDPTAWAGAEEQLAAAAAELTPAQLHRWGADLLNLLDQDGAEPEDSDGPDDRDSVNELLLTRNPRGSGGRVKGRFDDPLAYELISSVLQARSAPLTADDTRPLGQRQAEAMAAVFGFVAEHGDTDVAPASGGRRPHVSVVIRLEDLENRARAACLDLTGITTPAALRQLCCDAGVIPAVLNGTSQPLDIGRMSRTIPDGLRRAITIRDRGCAHPGCDRPPTWCQIHHIQPWEHGGPTALTNLVMLCTAHHREIHTGDWTVHINPDGQPVFTPPRWIDPEQRPRRRPQVPIPQPRQGRRPAAPTPPLPPPPLPPAGSASSRPPSRTVTDRNAPLRKGPPCPRPDTHPAPPPAPPVRTPARTLASHPPPRLPRGAPGQRSRS